MPDEIFAHPRLAAIYDAFDGARGDLTAYLDIAEELGARQVLDVGCGTGCLAVLLAERGHTVVGVDPAEASLQVAKAKSPNGRISWVHGDTSTLPQVDADLAVMTGNVAQVFVTDAEWVQALAGVRAALRPHGHFVFETRRPERRAWRDWPGVDVRDIEGVGRVERRLDLIDVSLPLVSFRYTYRFFVDDTVLTSTSTLRFRDRDEVEQTLTDQGYRVEEVREAPDRPGLEHVFIARRTDCPVDTGDSSKRRDRES